MIFCILFVRYLRQIQDARDAGHREVYMDKTWVNRGHFTSHQWQLNGQSARPKGAASGKGQRLIVTDAGGEDGYVDGAEMVFVSKTDYHQEMNSQV